MQESVLQVILIYLQNIIDRIQDGLNRDLAEAYPEYGIDSSCASWDILAAIFQKTGDKFIFVIDEWDSIFHMSFITEEDKKAYLLFLKSLLKDKPQKTGSQPFPCMIQKALCCLNIVPYPHSRFG